MSLGQHEACPLRQILTIRINTITLSRSARTTLCDLSEKRGQRMAQAPRIHSVQCAFPQTHAVLPLSRDLLPAFPNPFHPKGVAGVPSPPGSFPPPQEPLPLHTLYIIPPGLRTELLLLFVLWKVCLAFPVTL